MPKTRTEQTVKVAVRRDPTVPRGQPAQLHLICVCGQKIFIILGLETAVCPICSNEYTQNGWKVNRDA